MSCVRQTLRAFSETWGRQPSGLKGSGCSLRLAASKKPSTVAPASHVFKARPQCLGSGTLGFIQRGHFRCRLPETWSCVCVLCCCVAVTGLPEHPCVVHPTVLPGPSRNRCPTQFTPPACPRGAGSCFQGLRPGEGFGV